jgi:hypothetical protein
MPKYGEHALGMVSRRVEQELSCGHGLKLAQTLKRLKNGLL